MWGQCMGPPWQTSVVPVIGETENWASMGVVLAAAAVKLKIVLHGYDLTSEIAGFKGLQMNIDSKSLASQAAADLVRLKTRIVILMMFGPRNRLLLCAAFQRGFRNAVFMGMGWLPNGWEKLRSPEGSGSGPVFGSMPSVTSVSCGVMPKAVKVPLLQSGSMVSM